MLPLNNRNKEQSLHLYFSVFFAAFFLIILKTIKFIAAKLFMIYSNALKFYLIFFPNIYFDFKTN